MTKNTIYLCSAFCKVAIEKKKYFIKISSNGIVYLISV